MIIGNVGRINGKGVRNAKTPTKTDAFRNTHEILKGTSLLEEFVPLIPVKGGDNGEEALRVSNSEMSELRHSGSKDVDDHRQIRSWSILDH